MNICPGDFVLEIGSGHNPKPRANVLCDKFIEDDEQRGGGIIADRPLVEADGQYLPFADSAFDYVICSHVLEHVEKPALLLAELMRVAKRGYIETPSEIAERIYGWPYHHWVVNKIDGRLVLQEKVCEAENAADSPPHYGGFGQLFHTLAAEDKQWKRFHLTHHHLFLVQYEWEGEIDYELLPPGKSPLDLESPKTLAALRNAYPKNQWLPLIKNAIPSGIISRLKTAVGTIYRTRRGAEGIENGRALLQEILVCPRCKGEISWEEDNLQCATCERNYPIINGIPRLTV